jgi:hypothetical protein
LNDLTPAPNPAARTDRKRLTTDRRRGNVSMVQDPLMRLCRAFAKTVLQTPQPPAERLTGTLPRPAV